MSPLLGWLVLAGGAAAVDQIRCVDAARVAARMPGANALSCTTSGHGGKYGSLPSSGVPSSRHSNASGSSVTHGWSGEAWKAMSMANSIPASFALAIKRSKSSIVPSRGCTSL